MDYSNEFLARVYGAYLGCEVTHDNSIKTKLVGWDVLSHKEGSPVLEGTWKHREDTCRLWCYLDECKLLLTPVSAITDEDAVEVAKILGHKIADLYPNGYELRREDNGLMFDYTENGIILICAVRIYFNKRFYYKGHEEHFSYKAIDYLRSRGYDCGYSEIPSLISAGLAIDKTTLNN